jgi:type II secretory pathway component GspD/PulD (secretin)
MKSNPVHAGRRAMTSVWVPIMLLLTLAVFVHRTSAQSQPEETKGDFSTYQTFYLTDITDQHEANDIVTDLRNMLPRAKIYHVESQQAISVRGSAEDIQTAQKILADINRPHKVYRLTYSITEMDGDKNLGTQKVSVIVTDTGEKAILKQGSKVPIVTGTSTESSSALTSQVQYEDVGLAIEASISGSTDVVHIHTKISQSSVPDTRILAGMPDPDIQQTILEETAALVPGKALVLGSLDTPGGPRHEEISVVSELVR